MNRKVVKKAKKKVTKPLAKKKVTKPLAKKIGPRPKKETIPVNDLRVAAKAAAARRLNK